MNRRNSKLPVRWNTLFGTAAVRAENGNVILRSLNELSGARLNGLLFTDDSALILVKSSLRRVNASAGARLKPPSTGACSSLALKTFLRREKLSPPRLNGVLRLLLFFVMPTSNCWSPAASSTARSAALSICFAAFIALAIPGA